MKDKKFSTIYKVEFLIEIKHNNKHDLDTQRETIEDAIADLVQENKVSIRGMDGHICIMTCPDRVHKSHF